MRFHVQPRCTPIEVVARRLGLTLARFQELLPEYRRLGFPVPDPVSGNYDLEAIDRYIDAQNPSLFPQTYAPDRAITDRAVIKQRLAALVAEASDDDPHPRSKAGRAARKGLKL
ncbi:hypothetical protein [Paradevosia shaoguanensis]|uniref:hypothetical protein n=1 Tax=Paradevosia shaoguanensis TaxID=1335043 RepID=UPI003C76B890